MTVTFNDSNVNFDDLSPVNIVIHQWISIKCSQNPIYFICSTNQSTDLSVYEQIKMVFNNVRQFYL